MTDDQPTLIFKADHLAEPSMNPWGRISEVATRLGVAPVEWGTPGTITAKGADGKSYDVWEVAIAFLDRMESKT